MPATISASSGCVRDQGAHQTPHRQVERAVEAMHGDPALALPVEVYVGLDQSEVIMILERNVGQKISHRPPLGHDTSTG